MRDKLICLVMTARAFVVFRRKRWTAATLNEMLQGYRDGVSVADLAKSYDVTASAIRQQASKYGATRTAEYLSMVRREASGLPWVGGDD